MTFPAIAQEQQPRCAPMEKIKAGLAEVSEEIPISAGTLGDNVLVLFAGPSRSYTLVMLREDDIGCLVAAGHGWHDLPKGRPAEVRP